MPNFIEIQLGSHRVCLLEEYAKRFPKHKRLEANMKYYRIYRIEAENFKAFRNKWGRKYLSEAVLYGEFITQIREWGYHEPTKKRGRWMEYTTVGESYNFSNIECYIDLSEREMCQQFYKNISTELQILPEGDFRFTTLRRLNLADVDLNSMKSKSKHPITKRQSDVVKYKGKYIEREHFTDVKIQSCYKYVLAQMESQNSYKIKIKNCTFEKAGTNYLNVWSGSENFMVGPDIFLNTKHREIIKSLL